jgi:hypothetical protein
MMKAHRLTEQLIALPNSETAPEFVIQKQPDRSIFLWWPKRGITVRIHPDFVADFMEIMAGGYLQQGVVKIQMCTRQYSKCAWYILIVDHAIIEMDEFELGRLRRCFNGSSVVH